MEDTVFCGSCGTKMSPTAKFCASCGERQVPLTVSAARPPVAAPTATAGKTGQPQQSDGPTTAQEEVAGRRAFTTDREDATAPRGPTPPSSTTAGDSSRPAGDPSPADTEARPGGRAAERLDQIGPGAGELAGQIATQLQTPGVVAAGLSALLAAAALFVVALVLAIVFPDNSLIGAVGTEVGLVTEAFRQMARSLLVNFGTGDSSGRVGPALLVLLPIAGCALFSASQARRTRSMSPIQRLLWGAATGVPFALLMLIPALASGDADPSIGGTIFLGLVWGAIGGTVGAFVIARREGALPTPDSPGRAQRILPVAIAALRPLGLAIAVSALIGTTAWIVQAVREEPIARFGLTETTRSLPVAVADNALYMVEHGVHFTELGAGATFRLAGGSPIPVNDADELPSESFRMFDYRDNMSAYLFIPLLILLIAIPAMMALYAGFATARAVGAATPIMSAAWGAAVGPVWALVMVLMNALVKTNLSLFGEASGDSVFGVFLLGGAVLGALGGFLASQGRRTLPRPQ